MTETDPVSAAQREAALAYARTMLESEIADAAAEDALAAFGRTAAAQAAGTEADPKSEAANTTLLALTRLMTAVSVPDRSSPADRRQAVWASLGQTSHCTCRESAALLATRANNNIQPRESTALDEHLATCADCRELSARTIEADAAFRRELVPPKAPGGGMGSLSRNTYGALGALLAIVIVAIVLMSSGSGPSSKAALAPVQNQASAVLKTPVKVAKTTKPAIKHHVVKPTAKPKVKRHVIKKPVAHTTTTTAPSTTTTTPTGNTGGASATASTGGTHTSAAGNTGAATSKPAGTGTPASSAAQVSGSGSLPADSAPQQGIGSLTSTTP